MNEEAKLDRARRMAIGQQLSLVTGAMYKEEGLDGRSRERLTRWRGDHLIDYVMEVRPIGLNRYFIAIGVQRGFEAVETRYEGQMDTFKAKRLLNDPRLIVRIMVGQQNRP